MIMIMIYCFAGDRRLNKSSSYNCDSYGRNYAPAEPEWFTEGPVSQSDTIELRGFDTAYSERSRTRNASGSDASHDGSRQDGQKTKDTGGGKRGTAKNKEKSSNRSQEVAETSDAVLDDECRQNNDHGELRMLL